MSTWCAGYPAVFAYKTPERRTRPYRQLLWGEPVEIVVKAEAEDAFARCRLSGHPEDCWIRQGDLQRERLLEVSFLDFGEGDATLVVAPDGRRILVDAGVGDALSRYLRWRFRSGEVVIDAAVASHPDSDHYLGFSRLLEDPKVQISNLYINGLVERPGKNSLGPVVRSGGGRYVGGLVNGREDLEKELSETGPADRPGHRRTSAKRYAKVLNTALGAVVGDIARLSVDDGHVPGFAPPSRLSIEVLGPVAEKIEGRTCLRWLGSVGETKRGHSIVLRLTYGKIRVLLGGDPGEQGERLLLGHHTGREVYPGNPRELAALVAAARPRFESDVAKLCHHGGAGLTEAYLRSVNAVATIASLGNRELDFTHPETLGVIGRHSRGSYPLLFSLSEFAQGAARVRGRLRSLLAEARAETAKSAEPQERRQQKIGRLEEALDRSMAVYGAIHFRTDGKRGVIARKLERALHQSERWVVYPVEFDARGRLRYRDSILERSSPRKRTLSLWRPTILVRSGTRKPTVRSKDVYAVVEEIDQDEAVLTLSPWPRVDDRGRLVFADEEERCECVAVADLQRFINDSRDARQTARPLRAGDVFRIRFSGDLETGWREAEVTDLFLRESLSLLQDVTASAREAAKVALSAAITPVLESSEAKSMGLERDESLEGHEEGPGTAGGPESIAQPTV